VIGDGSLSGGLCFEGLNNAGHLKKDILVILNTNELSISPNVGAISNYLNKLISLPVYNRFKESLENFLLNRGKRGSRILSLTSKFEEGLKGLFIPGMLFEELGFRYFGPLDGHNLEALVHSLKNILTIKGPRILHVVTKKGKGYFASENEPVRFHGTGPFDIQSGLSLAKPAGSSTYTEVFSKKLVELAAADNKIIAVTAAMPEGTGLDKFRKLFPDRFFDVGIAEGHAVCFAAGLAKCGLKPVIAIYSTFLQRAYDQIIEDVALQNLPVIFCIDRAGIVGEDGATHQGVFDISFFNMIPNLAIAAPKDASELEGMLAFGINASLPLAIRYPKGEAAELLGKGQKIELGICGSDTKHNPTQSAKAQSAKAQSPQNSAAGATGATGAAGSTRPTFFATFADRNFSPGNNLKSKNFPTRRTSPLHGSPDQSPRGQDLRLPFDLVKGTSESAVPWAIPWPCIHEFYSIATNTRFCLSPWPGQGEYPRK